jgi:hypothetical protein
LSLKGHSQERKRDDDGNQVFRVHKFPLIEYPTAAGLTEFDAGDTNWSTGCYVSSAF